MKASWNGYHERFSGHVDVPSKSGFSSPRRTRSAKIEWVRWSHIARFMNWNAWAALSSLVEQVQPGLDPLQRRAATSNGLLGGVLEVLASPSAGSSIRFSSRSIQSS